MASLDQKENVNVSLNLIDCSPKFIYLNTLSSNLIIPMHLVTFLNYLFVKKINRPGRKTDIQLAPQS